MLLVGSSVLALSGSALAHDWYPKDCCSGRDCERAAKVDVLSNGDMAVYIKAGVVVVTKGFSKRPSPDCSYHVCTYQDDAGKFQPRCFWVPNCRREVAMR